MLSMRNRAAAALTALLTLTALQPSGADHPLSDIRPVSGEERTSATPALDSLFGDQIQPNIVVIMADDMRDDELRFMPKTRRLIGDQGVRFANAFSPHPLCCPARASFLTGQYTHNHKVWSNAEPWGFSALDDSATLPVWLNRAGYNTLMLGKYLNGYGSGKTPDGSSPLTYLPPGWTDWRGAVSGPEDWDDPEAGGTYRYYDTTLNDNGTLRGSPGRYQTRLFGDESEDMIAEAASSPRPFFLWASYVAPHSGTPREVDDPKPVQRTDGVTESYVTPARPRDVRGLFDTVIRQAPGHEGEADARDKPFFVRDLPQPTRSEQDALLAVALQRAESLSVLDAEVERTVDRLEQAGELDDTIVVFASDNGFFLGEHRMRRGKTLAYEPSLRVPMLMRGPGIPAGEIRTDPFLTTDFAPTFLEASGARPQPSVDGMSMLDVARSGDRGWSRGVLTETGPRRVGNGIAESDNWLVHGKGPSPLRFSQGVRTARYLYVEHRSHEKELYDLRNDPGQLTNIVDRPGESRVVRRLARVLDSLRNCSGAGCREPLPSALLDR
jgi:arylsulfatase A-like enzyme